MRTKRTDEEFQKQLSALLLSEGIARLTVGELAARLNCSRRRLYAIADTKEELLLAVARNFFSGLLLEGQEVLQQALPVPQAIAAYMNVGVRGSARVGIDFLTELDASRQGRKLFDDYQAARSQGLTSLIDSGVARGILAPRHAQVVAEVVLGAALRLRRPRFLARSGLTVEQAIHELYDLLMNGLLVHAPENARRVAKPLAPDAQESGQKRTARLKDEPEVVDPIFASWNRPEL